MDRKLLIIALCMTGIVFSGPPGLYAATDVPLISKEELKTLLENPDVIILDVRQGRDWSSSQFKIPGAVHADPGEFVNWIGNYPRDKQLVLYCA